MKGRLGGLLRSMPAAAWLCTAVALLNGLAWSITTPAFQVPDEMSHFAYAQYMAETGNPPRHVPGEYMSEEERRTLEAIGFFRTIGQPEHRPIWTDAEQRALEELQESPLDRVSDGSSSTAVNNPPLYYALQVAPYEAASGGTLLDRLFAMRLLSVLMSALTVLFVFLFLRELLPNQRWAWTTGALAVAFQPLFAFISTGVNSDSGLYLASAALFFTLARAFRLGLTPRRGLAIGLALGLGMVTKLTFVAFAPAAGLALLALLVRSEAPARARALKGAGVAIAVAVVPVALYVLLNEVAWDRQLFGSLVGPEAPPLEARAGSLREEISYIWQLYLPRLPFQADLLGGEAIRALWLNGFIGRFGWLDYGFPGWVYDLGLWVAIALVLLAVAGAVRSAPALRARWMEAAVYVVAVVGLALAIGRMGYTAFTSSPYPFEQARYLLPLLPLLAAGLALAALGLGRRWAPAAGALIVVLFAAHGFFSQLITIARYYG